MNFLKTFLNGAIADKATRYTSYLIPHTSLFIYCSLFIVHCSLLSGCGKKDVHAYYFPLKKLQEAPKVYVYKYAGRDTSFNLYWSYETHVQGDSVSFVGACYSPSFQTLLITIESQLYNGMLLKDLKYFGTDSTGKSVVKTATILAGAVFPFEVTDSNGVFLSNYIVTDPRDSTHTTTVTRNRRYMRDTSVTFNGENIPAIIFNLKEEQVEHDNKLGGWSHIFNIEEVYAKNIGLFSSKRFISANETFSGQLEKIIAMQEWEQTFRKNN